MSEVKNCHGCKWLDEYKYVGRGYCSHVMHSAGDKEKVRKPEMKRCELYEEGDFATRYRISNEEQEESEQE